MKPIDALFAKVDWRCAACGAKMNTCDCWVKCECGHMRLRTDTGECSNQMWHLAKKFSEEAADLIVADMAGAGKFLQREHIVARLKRTVIRHVHPIIIDTFEGIEAAKREAKNWHSD